MLTSPQVEKCLLSRGSITKLTITIGQSLTQNVILMFVAVWCYPTGLLNLQA